MPPNCGCCYHLLTGPQVLSGRVPACDRSRKPSSPQTSWEAEVRRVPGCREGKPDGHNPDPPSALLTFLEAFREDQGAKSLQSSTTPAVGGTLASHLQHRGVHRRQTPLQPGRSGGSLTWAPQGQGGPAACPGTLSKHWPGLTPPVLGGDRSPGQYQQPLALPSSGPWPGLPTARGGPGGEGAGQGDSGSPVQAPPSWSQRKGCQGGLPVGSDL